jgi:hypothetical protein
VWVIVFPILDSDCEAERWVRLIEWVRRVGVTISDGVLDCVTVRVCTTVKVRVGEVERDFVFVRPLRRMEGVRCDLVSDSVRVISFEPVYDGDPRLRLPLTETSSVRL